MGHTIRTATNSAGSRARKYQYIYILYIILCKQLRQTKQTQQTIENSESGKLNCGKTGRGFFRSVVLAVFPPRFIVFHCVFPQRPHQGPLSPIARCVIIERSVSPGYLPRSTTKQIQTKTGF